MSTTIDTLKRDLVMRRLRREATVADRARILPALERADRGGALPLSSAQERIWFIEYLQNVGSAYHVPGAVRLQGPLDLPALQKSLNTLAERHEVLRARFVQVEGTVTQVFASEPNFPLYEVDLSSVPEAERPTELRLRIEEYINIRFNLGTGPVARAHLLRFGSQDHVLLLVIHHIACDAWSFGIIVQELATLYGACRTSREHGLLPLPIQYADYAVWQRQNLNGAPIRRALEFWREHLQGAPAMLELPTDRPRPALQSHAAESIPMTFDPATSRAVRAFVQRHDITAFMLMYASFAVLMSRLSGQQDIVIGVPVANRQHTEVEPLVGLFLNTLALRIRLHDDMSVRELLRRVKSDTLEGFSHQQAPFDQVVEAVQPPRSLSHGTIFQVMLAWQNMPRTEMQLPGISLTWYELPTSSSVCDLWVRMLDDGERITGEFTYVKALFDRSTIERWMGGFRELLESLIKSPDQPLHALSFLSHGQRQQVLYSFNATAKPYPREKLLHGLFEEQVERAPDAPALVYDDQELTYAQLNSKANQVAHELRVRGVEPDVRVAICIERSLEMVVGLLGILKAGGAYVPLDPTLPSDRLAYMLEDAAPKLLLIHERMRAKLPLTEVAVIALDADWDVISDRPVFNPDPAQIGLCPNHLAYVIYTSGSTGQPKGAMNEHRGVVNRLLWMQSRYEMGPEDRVLQKTPFSFDVSVWEFFWTLMTGARLVIARPEGHRDPAYLLKLIESAGITRLHFVPSMLQAFLEQHRHGECAGLRHIVCSGEELPAALQASCHDHLPDARLSNLYGPTEAAIDVTAWECRASDSGARVPIGKPIHNVRMYVLDRLQQPVPVGVTGEIYIGGVGVGRGYLNRPALTAERFLSDPFTPEPARMYRTGDLGRWRTDGAIEYLGRNDFQVKLRGYRIELGEIEARLLAHRQVREAVVLAREDIPGEKRLVAYVVEDKLAGGTALSAEVLRRHLSANLPEYMVPGAFVVLERMPVSANGKLSRSALPLPGSNALVARPYEAPQPGAETILAEIWRNLLHVELVGRHDNFFELGGHSLLIVAMLDRLRRVALTTEVRRVFDSPILSDLAAALSRAGTAPSVVPANGIPAQADHITPEMLSLVELTPEHIARIVAEVPGGAANIQDIYPLVPLQEGILFHHLQNEEGGDTYVLPIVLSVSSRERLQELIGALQTVIARHDALRTAVLWEDLPRPVQVVYREASLPIEEVVLEPNRASTEQIAEWIKPELLRLNLQRAPLMRLRTAADPGSGQWLACLYLHHIVDDVTSLRMVIAEVVALLQGRAEHLPDSLPYRNHVAQVLEYSRQQDSAAFFSSKLSDVTQPTVPFGLSDVYGDGSYVDEAREDLEQGLARRLRAQARWLGVTAAALFHAAWGIVVAHTSGRDDVVFGTVLLGRLQGSAGAQRILGMFINTLPLRLRLQNVTARELVTQTQRELVELMNHEQASLAVAQRSSGVAASAPLFTALLNYRHADFEPDTHWSSAAGIQVVALQERTNYPITMSVDDFGEGFRLTAQTDRRLQVQRLLAYLHTAIGSLVMALESAPHAPAFGLPILPEDERQQVLQRFNATAFPSRAHESILLLFEEQVACTPNALALVCDGETLSYAELNRRSSQLAPSMALQDGGTLQLTASWEGSGVDRIVTLIAMLKAGAVCVPIGPRGSMLGHAAILNLSNGLQHSVFENHPDCRRVGLNLTPNSCFSLQALIHILWGRALYLISEAVYLDPETLLAFVTEHRIDILDVSPLQLRSLLAAGLLNQSAHAPPVVLVSGEALDPQLRNALAESTATAFYEIYRPVEYAVDVAATRLIELPSTESSAGGPLAGVAIYIVDSRGEPVPVGVTGEILVGGGALGWGYHGQASSTAEFFVCDYLGGRAGERLYVTGDLGRWNPDGSLELLGRNAGRVLSTDSEPQSIAVAAYAAPRTSDEELLVEIWADVLRVERVGIHDNFFEIGGDSLMMMRVVQRFNAAASWRITVMDIFRCPTIATLSARESNDATSQVDVPGTVDNADRRKRKIKRAADKALRARAKLPA